MDLLENPALLLPVASAVLLMLLCTNRVVDVDAAEDTEQDNCSDLDRLRQQSEASILDCEVMATAALHSFRLWSSVHLLGEDLGFWVKPRSTTWFSRFLLEQYDEERWVSMFRMTKSSVFALTDLLKPTIVKKDTKYRVAIPPVVRVACTLFKLTHGASLLVCSEMFAVGRSSVSMLLRQVVHAINDVLRGEISWPRGEKLLEVEAGFKQLCGLPGIAGAIDGTHIGISKPQIGPADYYYFKSGGYTLNCQAVVDSQKCFLDLFLGMPGSTHDARVLRRSSLFNKANRNCLWDVGASFEGFKPYLLGDAGYPLMSWLMVPHSEQTNLALADSLFNRRQRRGRVVVENAFGILKQTFRELLVKTELHVTILPDVIVACALLHNMLQRQGGEDLQRLLAVLEMEISGNNPPVQNAAHPGGPTAVPDDTPQQEALQKHRDLAVYLALQRQTPL